MIWAPDDPMGTMASEHALAAPGNDVDEDAYPWEGDIGPCLGCGAADVALCTCRPQGADAALDDETVGEALERVVTPHVYDLADLDMIDVVF